MLTRLALLVTLLGVIPLTVSAQDDGDNPVGAHDFLTGWQGADGGRWGRPAGVVVAPDGSLIVSDDQAGFLYRIAFTG